jgi:hypothetical protein
MLNKNVVLPHRIHGAGIYANIKGVYWWDPWSTIYIAAPWILWVHDGSWIHHRKFLMDPHLSINFGGSSGQTVSKLIPISCPVTPSLGVSSRPIWEIRGPEESRHIHEKWCEVDMSSMSHWSKMIQIYGLYSNPNGYIVDRYSMPSNMSYGKEPKWSKSFSGWQLRCPLLPHRDSSSYDDNDGQSWFIINNTNQQ